MNTHQPYANHPLLPLMQLLDSIHTGAEFNARRDEILNAIQLAAPVLKDRTSECCKLAKGTFLRSHGAATVPFRMARFVESRIKETLDLGRPLTKPVGSQSITRRKQAAQLTTQQRSIPSVSYRQLRELLPAISNIRTLGGRSEIIIHNPAGGHLTVINSRGNGYHVTEPNWKHASAIRKSNPANPWVTKLYSNYHFEDDHGLYHAAAILRAIEEGDFLEIEDHEAA